MMENSSTVSSNPIQNPDTFYVFLNMNNPITYHNITQTGCMVSAAYEWAHQDPSFRSEYLEGTVDYLPFIINQNRSRFPVSLFSLSAINFYRVEYEAEITRRHRFPKAPSRLSALYAFNSLKDCQKAHQLYRWELNSVRKFKLVKSPLTKILRVNMEIISLMRSVYPRATWDEQSINRIWTHYWAGQGKLELEVPVLDQGKIVHQKFSSGEIWEYLIEGRLDLLESYS